MIQGKFDLYRADRVYFGTRIAKDEARENRLMLDIRKNDIDA